ncbi:MAG: efflux RND transporter permease subunit [Pirellulales bacterium]
MPFDRPALWIIDHRRLVGGLVVAITLVATVGVSRLEFDDVPRSVFQSEDEGFRDLDALFAEFGNDDNQCLVVVESDELFSPVGIAALRRLTEGIAGIEGVERVRSMLDVVTFTPLGLPQPLLPPEGAAAASYAAARQAALDHPLLAGQLLSDDGATTLVVASITPRAERITDIEVVVERIREAAAAADVAPTLRVRLTGVPPIRVEVFSAVRRDSVRFMFLGIVSAGLMAVVLFRRLAAVVIVAAAPWLGTYWTLGAMGLVGEKINLINTVMPTLVMVVGFTDAVHLMFDIRHSLASGDSPLDASRSALRHLGTACALTSLTTAIGFSSLAVARVGVIQRFGLTCAAGAVFAFIAVITVVPLLASTWLGRHLVDHERPDFVRRHRAFFERMIDAIVARHRLVSVVGIAVIVVLGLSATQLRPDSWLTEAVPRRNDSYHALLHCDEAFGGTLPVSVVVEWPEEWRPIDTRLLETLADVEALVRDVPGARHPLSLLNVLRLFPGEATSGDSAVLVDILPTEVRRRFVHSDTRRAVVTARLRDVGSAANEPTFAAISSGLRQIEAERPGVRLTLTGTAVVATANINHMIVDLAESLALAVVAIFAVMGAVFRSLRLGILSIPSNVLPLAVTSALLVAVVGRLQLTSVIVFSICLGIAVDDTIHFINRFQRELALGGSVADAIRRSLIAVGSAILTTSAVLLVGFGCVTLSETPSSQLFAWLSCVAILSALLGDLVLLPALLAWWVPERGRPMKDGKA